MGILLVGVQIPLPAPISILKKRKKDFLFLLKAAKLRFKDELAHQVEIMLEASLDQNLLPIVLNKTKEFQTKKVTGMRMKVGEFAGVNSDALRFAFQNLSQETITQEASLQIIIPPYLLNVEMVRRP